MPVPHRQLLAYYSRNFGYEVPTSCYRSTYFSPYRIYTVSESGQSLETTDFVFRIDVNECAFPGAMCCTQQLDRLRLKLGASPVPVPAWIQEAACVHLAAAHA